MRHLLPIFLFVCCQLSYAEVYKTVDKDGNVKYSDNPPSEQSESMKLPELNMVPPEEQGQVPSPANQDHDQSPTNYEVDIISPRNEVVIPPGQRDLAVAISLNPSLHSNHLITYYIDGELIEETQSTNIVIQDPPRGGRTITVEVIDQSGEILGKSAPLIINVIRPILKRN